MEYERLKSSGIEIKPKFEIHYQKIMGEKYKDFIDYSLKYNRQSIRINTLKIDPETCIKRIEAKGWKIEKIPWCREGYWISSDRRDVGNLLEHVLGYIYIQESMSMVPPTQLELGEDLKVLDMCAAPGSKTTQIAQYMNNTGLLIANDIKGSRLASLGVNINRMGITNSIIGLQNGNHFTFVDFFDRVLCDAPCSGTGTIRKSLNTLRMWNLNLVKRLSRTQKKLIQTGFNALKPGGVMVYSTCSVEPDENEVVVSWLLENNENAQTMPIEIEMNRSPAFTNWDDKELMSGVKNCLRVHPYDNDTDGFFVCKIKKLE